MHTLNKRVFLFVPVLGGFAFTLISGVLNTTPNRILGASWHGWPLAWLYVIVYPGSPWSIDIANFILDIVFWSVVWVAVVYSCLNLRHKGKE